MKILALTQARGGSKGIPKKNLYPLNGWPLLGYTFEAVKKSKLITEYVVSTDDKEIVQFCLSEGVGYIPRPVHLAQDDTPSTPVIQHAVKYMEEQNNCTYDIIVDLRCTNPLKTAGDIDGAIQMLIDTGAESVIGVSPCHPVERIKRIKDLRITDILSEPKDGQRQNLELSYIRNGSIYAVTRDAIMGKGAFKWLSNGALFGHENSVAWVMPKERSINIDDMFDLKIAEMLLRERHTRERHEQNRR